MIKYFKRILKSKLIWIVFFAVVFLLIWFFALYIYEQINIPISSEFEQKHFVIQKGESLVQISTHLKKAGLIKNAFLFKFYVLSKGWAKQMQAGEYILNSCFNIPKIAEKIKKGETISDITITIPEGFNIRQIDVRLKNSNLKTQISKLQLKTQNFEEKYPFLKGSETLEGFLFPDTYKFKKDATEEEIVTKMLNNFDKKLTLDLRQEIERQGKTILQIITMASLLEKEVSSYEDRQIVSGIFWKRLKNNYPLESCATIAYILGIDKWRYSYNDTRINSPYNTYINTGLPPGPICNPGIQAIKAAIYPKQSEYNFFLTDPETGKTIFSKTLKEHNKNKLKYFGSN